MSNGISIFQDSLQKRSVKEPIGAAKAAFSVGNSWAFAHKSRLRVKGLALKEQDTPLKEQACHLRVKGHEFPRFSSEAKRKRAKLGLPKQPFLLETPGLSRVEIDLE